VSSYGLEPRPGLNPLRYQQLNHLPAALLDNLRAAQRTLGLDREEEYPMAMGLPKPVELPVERLFGHDFVESTAARVSTRCDAGDLGRICKSVGDAARGAEAVVVSVHAHEWGDSIDDPPEFLREFARAVIDHGATAVMGHGPHTLRGLELYRDRPIFYSLGNFIFEYEFISRLPSDTYQTLGVELDERPGRAMARLRFPDYPEYWQTVLPVLRVENGAVTSIDIFPVSLGFGQDARRHGRPGLASGEEATEILERFKKLSAALETAIEIEGSVLCVAQDRESQVSKLGAATSARDEPGG
jgi:poly-gamma-glutamate synthesis protein (capsule biosynthesis protein)